jgi:DNA-binding transcriptional ArsR family regulator
MIEAKRKLAELDAVVAALAHETRRQILLTIRFRGGAMSAGDIAGRFHCAWPTISRHMKVLEDSGLLVHEKQGRSRLYRVNGEKLKIVKEWLTWFEQPARVAKPEPAKRSTKTALSR